MKTLVGLFQGSKEERNCIEVLVCGVDFRFFEDLNLTRLGQIEILFGEIFLLTISNNLICLTL